MADNLRDTILRKVVRPEIRATVLLPTTGSVKRIYPTAQKLDVMIRAPWSGSEVLLRRLPILLTPGTASPLPQVGDAVTVAFQGRTLQSAVVLAKVDGNFSVAGREALAHEGKGAYLPDSM